MTYNSSRNFLYDVHYPNNIYLYWEKNIFFNQKFLIQKTKIFTWTHAFHNKLKGKKPNTSFLCVFCNIDTSVERGLSKEKGNILSEWSCFFPNAWSQKQSQFILSLVCALGACVHTHTHTKTTSGASDQKRSMLPHKPWIGNMSYNYGAAIRRQSSINLYAVLQLALTSACRGSQLLIGRDQFSGGASNPLHTLCGCS